MRRTFTILFLFVCLAVEAQPFTNGVQWIPTNEIDGTFDASSYDTGNSIGILSDYFTTYFYCMYPQWTNHIYSWGRSGSGWNGDYQLQEEQYCLALWASFPVPGYNFVQANDNEGLVSNTTYSAGLLIAAGPPLFYNGTAQTNEGIATAGIQFLPLGRVVHDGSDGDSGAIAGNAGSMQLASDRGVPVIDLWHRLWTNGWSGDVTGARILGFAAGSHPWPAGELAESYHMLQALNVETNIGSFTFNWLAATASTNHCVVSGVSVAGNALTATVHFDRMPMAWDVPDGTVTNDASGAFVAMPSLGNMFNWIIQVTNLPIGNYEIDVDGHFADNCTSAQLAAGRNWATNCVITNPLWQQRTAVLKWKRYQKGEDPVTLDAPQPPNPVYGIPGVAQTIIYQSGAKSSYQDSNLRGTNLVNALTNTINGLRQYDVKIQQAAIQTNHTFSFKLLQQAFSKTNRVGTARYGL